MLKFVTHHNERSRSDVKLCVQCNVYIHTRTGFEQHVQECSKYYCNICKKTFHSSQSFQKHLRSNCPPKRHICTKCKKSYSRKSDRDAHEQKCSVQTSFKCQECSQIFLTKQWYEQHTEKCRHLR